MDTGNVLTMIAVAGFLYIGGYIFLAKAIGGIALIAGIGTGISKTFNSSKEPSKSSSQAQVMDPIEIESKRKPDYTIPDDITMKVSPDKDAKESHTAKALKGTLGPTAKWLGKKIKGD